MEVLADKVTFEPTLRGGARPWLCGGGEFQAKRTVGAKVLRWVCIWRVLETLRRSMFG